MHMSLCVGSLKTSHNTRVSQRGTECLYSLQFQALGSSLSYPGSSWRKFITKQPGRLIPPKSPHLSKTCPCNSEWPLMWMAQVPIKLSNLSSQSSKQDILSSSDMVVTLSISDYNFSTSCSHKSSSWVWEDLNSLSLHPVPSTAFSRGSSPSLFLVLLSLQEDYGPKPEVSKQTCWSVQYLSLECWNTEFSDFQLKMQECCRNIVPIFYRENI